MAASIYVCESHGSACVVTYTFSECPLCDAEKQIEELEKTVKELEGKIEENDDGAN